MIVQSLPSGISAHDAIGLIPDLEAWYEANLLAGIDGASITTLPDSKNSWDATLSSGTAPVKKSAIQNGKTILRFGGGGSSAKMDINAGLMNGKTQGMCFIVLKAAVDPASSTGNSSGILNGFSGVTGSNVIHHYPYTDGHIYEPFGNDNRRDLGDPVTALNQFLIYEVESKAGSFIARINGTSIFTSAVNNPTFVLDANFGTTRQFGYAHNAGALPPEAFFNGDFAEALIFSRVLT